MDMVFQRPPKPGYVDNPGVVEGLAYPCADGQTCVIIADDPDVGILDGEIIELPDGDELLDRAVSVDPSLRTVKAGDVSAKKNPHVLLPKGQKANKYHKDTVAAKRKAKKENP